MTREQQIGQMLMVGFSGATASPAVLDLIKSGHVGGVILFSRNLQTPRQTLHLTRRLQAAARAAGHPFPLLIATDQENGVVRRTGAITSYFPGNMALGAIGSEAVAEDIARATGEELRALGITMNLAPVVDIASNPANPVIGVRSFGSGPEMVARLGAAATRGYQSAGIVATLKHFPGHGDTTTDSHRGLPVVVSDRERLESVELVPFVAGIAAGAKAVMTAHVAAPALTGSDTTPATLSPEALRDLLRKRLGFQGVIITDCMEMRAISDVAGVERGAVQAVRAGADIVLISHRARRQRAALEAIRAAADRGDISPEVILDAAERVLQVKRSLPSWDELPTVAGLDTLRSASHQRLADESYARSMTLISDAEGLIPLSRDNASRILVVTRQRPHVTLAADQGIAPELFVNALRRSLDTTAAGASVESISLPATPGDEDYAALQRQAARAATVILITCNANQDSRDRHHDNIRTIARVLLAAGRPVIGVAVCDPYDAQILPDARAWLATYDFSPPALEAAARVLVGRLSAQGKAPVPLLPA